MNQQDLDDIGARVGAAVDEFAPGFKPTVLQSTTACSLLRDMVQAAEAHGVTLEHFDGVADFPRMAIQLVQRRDARI